MLAAPNGSPVSVDDVGTVVEVLPPDGLEIECLDRDGRTRCVVTLTMDRVFILNRDRMPVA